MSLNALHEGAILVADSHCSAMRSVFLDFLRAIESEKIYTTQLILMGDNFDLLFGLVDETLHNNADAIALLNRLAKKIKIIYLEGNHDFALESLFENITVIKRSEQPLTLQYQDQKVALLHGDLNVPVSYALYTMLIRNTFILKILNRINETFDGIIIQKLMHSMKRKNHCRGIENFEQIARRHLHSPWAKDHDIVIEGHYHQNRRYDFGQIAYINLDAFACNERYYIVKSSQYQTILDEAIYCKEPE